MEIKLKNNMRNVFIIIIGIMFCVFLAACDRGINETSSFEKYEARTEEELGNLSDDEKRILSRGGYYAKERIYAGQLYPNEIEKVKKIRGAKDYLKEKYPDQEIIINLYESRGKNSKSPTGNIGDDLIWISADGLDTLTWVKVKETEEGYEYYDNWEEREE